jgi:catechol 2,3-dioxygenase-like lactoylglutathione lyase family enzyme
MQAFVGVFRIYLKGGTILLAVGALLQLAPAYTPGQAEAQRAALLQVAQNTLKRPRITRIDHIRLYVTDVGKATEFYGKILGRPTTTAYGCRTTSLPCFPVNNEQQIELQPVALLAPNNWIAEVAYATDNIEQMHRYLLASNLHVTPITKDLDNALHFELRDPEGNALSFIQRREGSPDFVTIGNRVTRTLIHAGFVVKDMAAENHFYVDLLGFKLYWYGGMKDDGVDWYELQVPDGDNWIEYMLNVPATANHKQLGAQNHFSFGVKEIQAAADQLRKNGIEKIVGPGIGRDGKRGLNLYDPDDTRVEVTEFTPAREPCCHAYTASHPTP